MSNEERSFRIGELARLTGLTVRALHHYDAIGLLKPDRRESGYRVYGDADVQRLYQIVALRSLDISLEAIASILDQGVDLAEVVARQLDDLDQQLELQQKLRARLSHIHVVLEQGGVVKTEQLLPTIERITVIEQHFTPEQLEQLEQRRKAIGPEVMEQAQKDWMALIAEFESQITLGTDSTDPAIKPLAARWGKLMDAFTDNDPAIRESVERMYADDPVAASHGTVSRELYDYIKQAEAHWGSR